MIRLRSVVRPASLTRIGLPAFAALAVIFLSPACPPPVERGVWAESSFVDFADGLFDGGGNIYAAANGTLRPAWSPDLDGDGWPDAVLTNFSKDPANTDPGVVYVYWGGADGFDSSRRTRLPQASSIAAAIGDLDNDGLPDLVFNGALTAENQGRFFTVFLSAPGGFSAESAVEFELSKPFACAVADLDSSGYLDIAFSCTQEDGQRGIALFTDPFGTSPAEKFIPVDGVDFLTIADLNGDNSLDIVATVHKCGGGYECNSLILWNRNGKFSDGDAAQLPSTGGHGSTVADLDSDGHLDIIINDFGDRVTYELPSRVYLGSESGFNPSNFISLDTMGAGESSVADFNADGHLDIVFCNWSDNMGAESEGVSAYIYWGSERGFNAQSRSTLPSVFATGGAALDFNRDGFPDILINNQGGEKSYLYYGSAQGFSVSDRIEFESHESMPTQMRDFGNIFDRRPRDSYASSVFDAGAAVRWKRCSWTASGGSKGAIRIFLRFGAISLREPGWGDWVEAANGSQIPDLPFARYAQYEVVFDYGDYSLPALSEIRLEYDKLR